MIPATLACKIHFKGSKITTNIGSAKFVIKSGSTDGALNHNVERRYDTIRLTVILLPRLNKIWNLQVGHSKTN